MLSQIMRKTLKSVPAGTSVVEAAQQMRDEKVGALLVEQKGTFVGLLTETDIVRRGVGARKNLDQTVVEQLMSTNLPSIQVSRTSHEAYDMMGDLGVRHLLISDQDTIVGLVSMRDLLAHFRSYEPNMGID